MSPTPFFLVGSLPGYLFVLSSPSAHLSAAAHRFSSPPNRRTSESACAAIAQLNDHPEDEDTYASEIVVLEGKELRILKYSPGPGAFDVDQLTGPVCVLGFEVTTPWEVLGRPGLCGREPGHASRRDRGNRQAQ